MPPPPQSFDASYAPGSFQVMKEEIKLGHLLTFLLFILYIIDEFSKDRVTKTVPFLPDRKLFGGEASKHLRVYGSWQCDSVHHTEPDEIITI